MQWAAITIEAEGEAASEAATKVLLDLGCNGVALDNADETVTGYLPSDDRLEANLRRIKAVLAMLPALGIAGVAEEITVRFVREEEWATAWKAFFKPIRVGRRLIVSPPWEDSGASDTDCVVVIDPGMAFGTGNHATTQLCLAALEDYVSPGGRVADIGTGSGILAIAAAKLGAKEVVATDVDPNALPIAQRNAAANAVSLNTSVELPTNGPFDLVVSNILANTLIELAFDLARLTRPAGTLIASGIIEERMGDVRLALEAAGFTWIESRRREEWVALVLRKDSTPG